jgi:hypothetical protein
MEDNLLDAFGLSEITDDFLEQNHLVKFEPPMVPVGSHATGDTGYSLHEDGIVRLDITTVAMTQAEKLDMWVRRGRNFELSASDWTQMADAPFSAEKKLAWAQYRQELRDMTTVYANITDPSEIVRPTKPV